MRAGAIDLGPDASLSFCVFGSECQLAPTVNERPYLSIEFRS